MSIIIMILLLSVLILVHEAGHFLAAKMFKMKVSKFGFGLPIGPTLWEGKVGDVQVLVHAFLLGFLMMKKMKNFLLILLTDL